MQLILLMALLVGSGLTLAAQTEAQAQGDAENQQKAPFQIGDVITESVASLKPPRWYDELVSVKIAITANSTEVQKHVTHGTALIHAGWDFEAYRHFVEAIKKDPECAMAYWGISLALANGNSELNKQRFAAVQRMRELVELGKTTPVERAQIESLSFIFSNEPQRAPKVFELVALEFPNNIQLALMSAFMKRDGYDTLFGARAGQKEALQEVTAILKKNPENQMALSFWIALHAEHPDGTGEIRQMVLPRVRDLAKAAPEFPPYRELVGHFEWRAGNLQLARQEFQKAVALYQDYMTADGLEYYDCPNFIRAQLYLATVHQSLGAYPEALEIANFLQKLPLSDDRIASAGATLLLWEGKTLGARLLLAKGDLKGALAALPAKSEGSALRERSPAVMAWEGWQLLLSSRIAIQEKNWEDVRRYILGVAASDALLESALPVVAVGSGRSELPRTRQGLKVEWMISKALEKMAQSPNGEDQQADFWLRSAVDEQVPPRGTFPPLLLSPATVAFAEYQQNVGNSDEARKIYQEALRESPNHTVVLQSYVGFLESQNEKDAAAKMRKHIELVKGSGA